MADPNVDALINKYKSSGNSSTATNDNVDVDALINKYKSSTPAEVTAPTPEPTPAAKPDLSKERMSFGIAPVLARAPGLIPSVGMGVLDVGNTLHGIHASMVDTVDRLFKRPNRNLAKQSEEGTERVNKLYDENYKDLRGSGIGRVAGQIAASAPLIPGATIAQGVKTSMGAMPTILATGEKIAAPLTRRIAASSVTGGIVGGEFGALTSSGSEDDLSTHVGKNILGGMVANPFVQGAANVASKVIPAVRSWAGNNAINVFANRYGITPNAAKRVMAEFENEGLTLADAEAQLSSLGANATIGDLTPGLQKFVGALAQRGGRSTAVIENRYAQRAELADNEAHNIMQQRLGPKPDVVVERGKLSGTEADKIHDAANNSVRSDYNTSYSNPKKLSVYSLIGDINTQLESAAGAKSSALKEAKGYLYKTVKDPVTGADVQQVRSSVKDLHESRQALDDLIEKRGDSLPPRALRAVQGVRAEVDKQLKTIPEFARADTKFAKAMDIKEGLQIGYEALHKGSFQNFEKIFNAASPELKETIHKGMRAKIGDQIEQAANGEMSGAQQLFKKRTATREKLRIAFGANGEEVLDALAKQAVLRRTEKMASEGSRTAINTRINALLDNTSKPSGVLSETIKGVAGDVIAGTPGAVATIMGARRAGGNIIDKVGKVRQDANVESFADLVSRSGTDLSNSLSILRRVESIQKNIIGNNKNSGKMISKLPVSLLAPSVGEPMIDYGEKGATFGKNISKHWYNTFIKPYME